MDPSHSDECLEGFRLSTQQRRAWRLMRGGGLPRLWCTLAIDGAIDSRALRVALQAAVRRHEMLRTTFHWLPGMEEPVQVIAPAARAAYTVVDLRESDAARQKAVIAAFCEGVDRPASLRTGCSLLAASCLQQSDERAILALTLPALCADARALTNVAEEIVTSLASPRTAQDEDEPLQYAQFSEWQHELLSEEGGAPGRTFWQEAMHACAPAPLPLRRPRSAGMRYSPSRWTTEVEPELAALVERAARRGRTSNAAVWQAGFAVLVWRLTGRSPVTVGKVCAGRKYEELQRAIGPFASVVPSTASLHPDDSFAEALSRVHESGEQIDAFLDHFAADEHEEALAAACGTTVLPVQFEFQERPACRAANGVQFTLTDLHGALEPCELALRVVSIGNRLQLEWIYDSAIISDATPSVYDRYFRTLMRGALEDTQRRLDTLTLLDDDARTQALHGINPVPAPLDASADVPSVVSRIAAMHPASIAVECGHRLLTYAELDDESNRLATLLRAHGVGPEQRVGLFLERSPELIVALLGVLKAGGAYVPLDPGDPPDRTSFMLADADVHVLVTTTAHRARIASASHDNAAIVCLDEPRAESSSASLDSSAASGAGPAIHPDNLAYVLYTSGSTGRPKGVMISHRGMANYFAWCAGLYDLGHGGSPAYSPITFDLCLTTLIGPLLCGGRVILLPEALGPEAIIDALQREETFGVVKMTPAHLQLVRQHVPDAAIRCSIRTLIVGGEAFDLDEAMWWSAHRPETRLFNEYGPTEAVVGCCVHRVTGVTSEQEVGSVPIGRPIANTRLYVLDERFEPAPLGVAGDLYIGGDGLARGYHGRPGLTADRFIPDPTGGGGAGARLYRTGDRARRLPDGTLEFLGRGDQQVKVGGVRIELEEIEAVLRTAPSVHQAAVVVRDDPRGAKRLVAYVSAAPTSAPSASARQGASAATPLSVVELRRHLRGRLPGYMIPAAFVPIDVMPMTRSGKVDRRALPAESDATSRADVSYAPPRTLIEDTLAMIWADVLNRDAVGIHDNFFALGGDSIRSIQVRARAQQRGLPLSHEQLFQNQTVAELARAIATAGGDATLAAAAVTERVAPFSLIGDTDRAKLPSGLTDAYPLSTLQAGMIFHSELARASAIYHDVHSFTLEMPFDAARLSEAIRGALHRHPVLRTSFDLHSYDEPLQLVHADVALPLTVDDVRGLEREAQARALAEWRERDREHHFAWDRAPLVRFHVHVLSDATLQFTMTFHHATLDGWSAASLLTELFNRYVRLLDDAEATDEGELACAYRDFVAIERATLRSPEAEAFWIAQLDGGAYAPLPADADGQPAGADIGLVHVTVSDDVAHGLSRVARAASVPLKSVLLAAHLRVLSIWTATGRPVTGLVSNGRLEEQDGDRLLGLFLNVLPFALTVGGGTWQDLIRDVFAHERAMLPHRRYPAAALQQRRGGQPLFDVAFNYMHYHVYEGLTRAAGVRVVDYDGYEETNVPLLANFATDVGRGTLRVSLNYRAAQLSAAQVSRMAESYARALEALARAPDGRYDEVGLVSAEEQAQILETWNATAIDLGPPCGLHELVAAQAARTPEAIAVAGEDGTLTYAALMARAIAIARELRARGVDAESPVGVLLERETALVPSLLGVMLAGGAYVPLDTSYPAARLQHMVQDSGARLVITTRRLDEASREALAETPRLYVDAPEPQKQELGGFVAPRTWPGQAAYVIYTSGSTGQPKGVINTHEAIVNRLRWMQAAYALTPADRVLQKTPISFDVSVWELFWPLITGARMVLARPGGHQDSAYLAQVMAEAGITVAHFVPSMLTAWLDEPGLSMQARTLRRIICSGEALSGAQQARVEATLEGAALSNLYGPTEAAVDVSAWECVRGEAPIGGGVPIGQPIANLRWYVREPDGPPVPVGVAGELQLGGIGLARGYHRRPGLTAERFVPDPFGPPGARLYRTGDRARYRPDGAVEYLGRLDGQIKLRGQRIELGEIEAALAALPDLRDAAVSVSGDGEHLLAYVVTASGVEAVSDDAWRAALAERLPGFMIPARFVRLPALPRTPNGKLDRRALTSMPVSIAPDAEAIDDRDAAPHTPTEHIVADVWAAVLRQPRVPRHATFFELGGHSLTATQVVSRLRAAFDVDLPLRDLFELRTVARLAASIDARLAARPADGAPASSPIEIAAAENDGLDHLMADLEQLSEEDLRALLGSDVG